MHVALTVLTYLLAAVFLTAFIVGIVFVAVEIHNRITELLAVSKAERRKRKQDNDDFFYKLRVDQAARFDRTEKPLWTHNFR